MANIIEQNTVAKRNSIPISLVVQMTFFSALYYLMTFQKY